MSIYDKASLVLIPSGTKTSKVYSQKPVNGDGDFTFSRSTAATRVNADGNIEKETQNLINYSNTFSTGWVQDRILSATSGQAGYDGTNDAWFVVPTNVITYHTIRQSSSQTGVVTISVYAKAETYDGILLYSSSNTNGKFFNVSNGTLGDDFGSNVIDATITDVGNGWYRCSVTLNKTGTGNVEVLLSSDGVSTYTFAGDGVGGVYIQDFQLEQGLVARDYIETTTAAVEGGITDNVPRLDYTDSSCPALLLEPQRTNVYTHSEYFEGWTKNNAVTTINATTSPEGLQNAIKLAGSAANGQHTLYYVNLGTNTTYSHSAFYKAGEYSYAYMRAGGNTNDPYVIYDLTDQSVIGSAACTHDIESVGNDWYRITMTPNSASGVQATNLMFLPSSGYTLDSINIPSFTGDGTSGGYIYGAQLEAGSYATSYIPTYGTSVTRNADDCRITGISDIVSSSEYTLFWEGSHIPTGEYNSFATIFNNSAVNQSSRFYRNNTDNQIYAAAFISGSSVTIGSGVTDEYAKCAFRVKSGDFALYVNGSLVGSNTSTMTPSATLDSISMQYFYSSQSFDQRTDQFMFFNQALSNEELATLTTI